MPKFNKRVASVHLTQIINGKKAEVYLCEQCAQENNELSLFAPFNISDFFSDLLSIQDETLPTHKYEQPHMRCEKCGLTFDEFRSSGRLGCSNCYTKFDKRIAPILRRIHNGVKHTGKMPSNISPALRLNGEVAELKTQLEKAISEERYEDAAKLRDKIKMLTETK